MTREEAQAYYKGKEFYIINSDGSLDGPREDIYYAVLSPDQKPLLGKQKYKFVQIVDGKPVYAFTEEEIKVVQK